MNEVDTSDEDEYRETSRFGEGHNKFKTMDATNKAAFKNGVNITQIRQPREGQGQKNDFSDFTDENLQRVIEGDIPDETLSLSNVTKERQTKSKISKNSKKEKKYKIMDKINTAALRKGEFSQISKIERGNNSGMSHSYDFFTNANITPIPAFREHSSYSNNRYALKQGISKSDLSTSFVKNPNRQKLLDSGHERFFRVDKTPTATFGLKNHSMIDPIAQTKFNLRHPSHGVFAEELYKSQSDISNHRSSVSRIFQPEPEK